MKAASLSRPRATPLSLEAMVVDGMGKSGASWGVGGLLGEGGEGGCHALSSQVPSCLWS